MPHLTAWHTDQTTVTRSHSESPTSAADILSNSHRSNLSNCHRSNLFPPRKKPDRTRTAGPLPGAWSGCGPAQPPAWIQPAIGSGVPSRLDRNQRATTAFYGLVRPPALHSSPVSLGEAPDALARGFSFSSPLRRVVPSPTTPGRLPYAIPPSAAS